MKPTRISFGPWRKGINRAVAKPALGRDELWDAVGVYQDEIGSLQGCFETANKVIEFPDSSETVTGKKKVPLRVIHFPEDGAVWQLYSKDYQTTNTTASTSVRRQGTDREYADYPATGVVYSGFLILCGDGQQALAIHRDWSCNRTVVITSATYTDGTGVVSAITFAAGELENLIVGDIVELADGARHAVTAVDHSGGTFTIASGLGSISLASATVERFRPIRLGAAYYEEHGTVAVTNGSKTVTLSSTNQLQANQYITFAGIGDDAANPVVTWSKANMDYRSYKISSVSSGTQIILEDAYEGATSTQSSCRAATEALLVALPFVYGGRLCAVGANSASGGDYNVIYWSGFPGQASPTVLDNDIFDFMYWDVTNAFYPVGNNEGAIQRVVPQDNRMVVFLQNGIYVVRNTLPVDAALGSDLADSQIAPGLGATTYDGVEVAPDNIIYFASPDGLFRLYGTTIEPIDRKIRNHELYTNGMQWAAYYEGRIYFTDGEDDPHRVVGPVNGFLGIRAQYAVTWILDLTNGEWTCNQRVTASELPTNQANHDYRPIYPLGYHGGIFAPYRGALAVDEQLLVAVPGGLARMNYADDKQGADYSLIYAHAGRVIPAMPTLETSQPKRIRGVYLLGASDFSRSVTLEAIREFDPVTLAPPSAPQNVKAETDITAAGTLIISWDMAARATSYNVYEATSSGGVFSLIASSLTGTMYRRTGLGDNETRYYKVSAVNNQGESALSAEVNGTTANYLLFDPLSDTSSGWTTLDLSPTFSAGTFAGGAAGRDLGSAPRIIKGAISGTDWIYSRLYFCRNAMTGSSTYSLLVVNTGWYLYKGASVLKSWHTTPAGNERFEIRIVPGGNIEVYINGTLRLSDADTEYRSNTFFALEVNGSIKFAVDPEVGAFTVLG